MDRKELTNCNSISDVNEKIIESFFLNYIDNLDDVNINEIIDSIEFIIKKDKKDKAS